MLTTAYPTQYELKIYYNKTISWDVLKFRSGSYTERDFKFLKLSDLYTCVRIRCRHFVLCKDTILYYHDILWYKITWLWLTQILWSVSFLFYANHWTQSQERLLYMPWNDATLSFLQLQTGCLTRRQPRLAMWADPWNGFLDAGCQQAKPCIKPQYQHYNFL